MSRYQTTPSTAQCSRLLGPASFKRAFTLVELLTVIAIIGVLAGLLLPAVQQARESARRIQCSNNLKNMTLAVLSFESTYKFLPPGRDMRNQLEYAWSFKILPWVEQENLYKQFDAKKPWDFPSHLNARQTQIPLFQCPTSMKSPPGESDYAGINGSVLGNSTGDAFDRGVMVLVTSNNNLITLASVTDGTSNTLCISENPDREFPIGTWIHGMNCISHDAGTIGATPEGIRSLHSGGANASNMDGSVRFLSRGMPADLIGALATRNGEETITLEQ